MKLEKIIFSIDDCHDISVLARFLRYISGLNAMGKLAMEPVQMIGGYESSLELSWMVTAMDFDKHIRESDWLKGQKSVLHVPGDQRQTCHLEMLKDGKLVHLNQMENESPQECWGGFSYRMDEGSYWVC